MIFRNLSVENKSSGLFVDDILETVSKTMPKEILERMPMPEKGKVIHGTLGTFNIKDFEKMTEMLKHDANNLCI